MKHVMLDLETWGLLPGCGIRSIGAVAFDFGQLGPRFYRNTGSPQSLQIEHSTIEWWSNQPAETQAVLKVNQIPLREAMGDFSEWWDMIGAEYVWAHGAAFDIPIYQVAADVCEVRVPWHYRNVFDTRTLHWIKGFDEKSVQIAGAVEHNALDDAVRQAVALIEAYRK